MANLKNPIVGKEGLDYNSRQGNCVEEKIMGFRTFFKQALAWSRNGKRTEYVIPEIPDYRSGAN
ncbi:hypothetical protein ACTQWG_07610 [Blautia sp. HCP3S3_H10_1]|uniref:hypothetical protein n=1 Tax=unclassified Blautia TaxID=2648079 RepID=UPI003F91C11A